MNYETSDFYCIHCGNKGIPIQRQSGRKKEPFHRKKLYCPFCRNTVNHIECKNDFEVDTFKQNFAKGEYLQEAKESVEVCKYV